MSQLGLIRGILSYMKERTLAVGMITLQLSITSLPIVCILSASNISAESIVIPWRHITTLVYPDLFPKMSVGLPVTVT